MHGTRATAIALRVCAINLGDTDCQAFAVPITRHLIRRIGSIRRRWRRTGPLRLPVHQP
ncbi:hypothetical protein ACIQC5_03420 [Paenarthrobacter sp. NPDC092416]|uniref:hypothetical protein n=1 Tax=Paenarthrobacter sp. NPDC092416 TaxID=3364386 RepID=UPI00381749E5